MVEIVFLYYPEGAYIQEARTNLNELEPNIRMVKATPEIVSNLVPYHLQHSAESWLIFYRRDRQQELLISPLKNTNETYSRGNLADLIPILKRFFGENRRIIPPEWVGQFEYLHIDASLDSLLDLVQIQQSEGQESVQNAIFLFQQISQDIQKTRTDELRRAAASGNFRLLNKLDNILSDAADKLFKFISGKCFREVVPEIVKDFAGIMDPTTKRFLITSETVQEFARQHKPANFDYSAPGCGLWKAVERELNLSLILHLRRSGGVITNVYHPWKKSANAPGKFPILIGEKASQDLSETKGSENLEGIMLGPMELMLEWEHCNTVKEKLGNFSTLKGKPYLPTSFPEDLKQIRTLRNGHAHISAMSKQKFNELRNLVLPSPSGKEASTCLLEILQLKETIFDYWKGKGDCPTYVTTTDHECVDFSPYNETEVIRSGKSTWKLVAIDGNATQLCIANFNDKNTADTALASLDEAVTTRTQKAWDANEEAPEAL